MHYCHHCHHHHHNHLPVVYAVGVTTDLHKLLHSWRSWVEDVTIIIIIIIAGAVAEE